MDIQARVIGYYLWALFTFFFSCWLRIVVLYYKRDTPVVVLHLPFNRCDIDNAYLNNNSTVCLSVSVGRQLYAIKYLPQKEVKSATFSVVTIRARLLI